MSGDDSPDGEGQNALFGLLSTITPGFIRRSFAIKFGLVLLVMAASIGVIGAAATQTMAAETETDVESDFLSMATQESDIIQEWVERNRLTTRLISTSGNWSTTSSSELGLFLNSERSRLSDEVLAMHILDRSGDGYTVAGTTEDTLETGSSVSGTRLAWANSRSGELSELAASEVRTQDTYRIGTEHGVAFVTPTPARQGRLLVVEVSVYPITSSLQGSQQTGAGTEGGFTQVVNESGTVIINAKTPAANASDAEVQRTNPLVQYTDSEDAMVPFERAQALRESTSERAGVITRMEGNDVVDETYTVGYSPVDDQEGWAVLTHASRSNVFGFVQTIQTYGLVATVFAILLIAITGALLGYSTSRSIDRLTAKTEQMQEGDLDVTFYTSRVDNIGRLYDGFASMRDALKNQIQEAERSRKEAEVARAEAEEMATYLQEKAEEYSEIMQQCAAGDLTQRMSKDSEEESMDRIADEFNEMIEELEKTTGQLKSYVDEVEEAGAEVEQSANTVRQASEQVADSIQRISDGAYDQKERLQQISETMDEVAASLQSVADDHPDVDFADPLGQLQEISATIEETADLSQETMGEAENVAGAAEEQAAELNEVGERAHDLQRYAQPLRDILNRFDTEAEHEFVFSVGPTGGTATPNFQGDDEESADGEE